MLRDQLMKNVMSLREQISRARGMEVYGDPSAIVCVKTGDEALARMTARELPDLGLISNLVEFPAVAKGEARFRLQGDGGRTPEAADGRRRAHRAPPWTIARRRLEAGVRRGRDRAWRWPAERSTGAGAEKMPDQDIDDQHKPRPVVGTAGLYQPVVPANLLHSRTHQGLAQVFVATHFARAPL